jgi:two-component SAPR family response regulator
MIFDSKWHEGSTDHSVIRVFGGFNIQEGQLCIRNLLSKSELELLLFIYLFTRIRPEFCPEAGNGINTLMAEKYIWQEISKTSLANRKNVMIAKIRKKTERFDAFQIVFRKGYHLLDINLQVKQELDEFFHLKSVSPSHEAYTDLLVLAKNGHFLKDSGYTWTEKMGKRLNTDMILSLTKAFNFFPTEDEMTKELAEAVLLYDAYDETAIERLISHLIVNGHRGIAQERYHYYEKQYLDCFNEKLPFRFLELFQK